MDTQTSGKSGSFLERYMTPIAVLLGAGIIALAFIYGHPGAGTPPADGAKPAAAVNIKDVKTDRDPFVGTANAPVTMAIWFDYQCPFCKQLDQSVTTQLYENYVKTGKLRIVFKDFQFLGKDSVAGAEFGRAVWQAYPEQYYAWYQAMFVAQDAEGDQGFGNTDTIVAMTKKDVPGIDTARVLKLITDNKAAYDAAIAADRDEGAKFGIQGTPAFIIGTTMESGAQPYASVAALIDAQLKK